MAFSKPLLLLLLIAAAAMSAAAQGGSQATCNGHKVTVQNLCGQELRMESIQPVADSKVLFNPGWVLPNNQHAEFPVCAWTGRLKAVGAVEVDIHLGHDDGAYYKVSTAQSGTRCRVSVTPHGKLAGTCPTAGCAAGGKCFQHESPKGDCRGVTEIKIVYYAAV
ncbi:uncharacterized protein LOC100822077 [Brachypodium distachyon]|uniref:Uncharacterized protein n=1 Tax=Brachypodium distachyon TaxID=15368 RepID=I1IHC8_BRADI|nr:uncharacterized protein LOC100822077 [Brachypodium distachyon]KQJ86241.1 hypothetical protein BRADI_4g04200v3 [Brachypodium distachyon]|eukprot:XP_003578914.1 uncharacterized protein LOC100822077 [Brachypodium distachyon]